jgi:hypothetical protein
MAVAEEAVVVAVVNRETVPEFGSSAQRCLNTAFKYCAVLIHRLKLQRLKFCVRQAAPGQIAQVVAQGKLGRQRLERFILRRADIGAFSGA